MMIRSDSKLQKLHEDFKKFYDKELLKDYIKLEAKRKKYLKIFWFSLFGSILFLFWVPVFFDAIGFDGENANNLYEFLFAIALFVLGLPIIYFKCDTQNTVMNKIVSFFGDMKYGINRIFDKDIEASELIGHYDEAIIDDSFCGKYKGVDIKVSEQRLVRKGRKTTITVFRGVFVMLDFDKPFEGKTIVQRKYKYNLFFLIISCFFALNVICSLFSDFSFIRMCKTLILWGVVGIVFGVVSLNKNNKEEVKLEDVVFSKKWNVYATDQIEARYLLTTAFMERILEVKRRFKGMNIEFSFFDNKLLIAIPSSKDMFETTSLFKPALSYYRMQNVVYQFYSIFSIIDLLKIKGNQKDESK